MTKLVPGVVAALGVALLVPLSAVAAQPFPDPVADASLAATKGSETAVLAGGCFWGVEAVFDHLKGVKNVVAGFSGGSKSTAHYETVSTGRTGHAESVKITYDPSRVTYGQLLKIFFSVAHDPTELNRQGPDEGRNTAQRFSTKMPSRKKWLKLTFSNSISLMSSGVRS